MTVAHWSLMPYVDAVRDAGFDVHVPRPTDRPRPARHVFITRQGLPGCALMQTSGFPSLGQPPELSVPVFPDREHGSAVAVDFEGAPAAIVPVLEQVLASGTVLTRFVKQPRHVRVDRRVPAAALQLDGARLSEEARSA